MPKCILIADDSAIVRKSLRSVLVQQPGWEVCGEAVDGRDTIQKAQELNPDLIVIDLSMPVMNGFEAARELQRIMPSTPLLMFTTFMTPHLKQEARDAGFSGVVGKSEGVSALLREIRQLLEMSA